MYKSLILILCILLSSCSFNPRRAIGPSVVKITKHSNSQTGGTGFYVQGASGKSYILTNAHVCGLQEAGIIDISDDDSDRYIPRHVLEVSEVSDLCLIEALPGHDSLQLANSPLGVGDKLYIVGHPLLSPLTVSTGEVIGYSTISLVDHVMEDEKDTCIGPRKHIENVNLAWFSIKACIIDRDSIETDSVIYPGNSGSPAVNSSGRLIGVVFAGDQRNNHGYLVTLSQVQDFLKYY